MKKEGRKQDGIADNIVALLIPGAMPHLPVALQ